MKKVLLIAALAVLPFTGASSALAANWTNEVQAAINSGNFSQIDVIGAKNPQDEGDIALYLLQQSQNSALKQDVRIKIFDSTMPFGSQIALDDAGEAGKVILAMLNLAGDPQFQKDHPTEAAGIVSTALSLSDQPNIVTSNPNIHELALALAGELGPDADPKLKDQVDLALQIGLPPPVGPRGIITPYVPPLATTQTVIHPSED